MCTRDKYWIEVKNVTKKLPKHYLQAKKNVTRSKRGEHLNSSPAKHPALSETGICSARN